MEWNICYNIQRVKQISVECLFFTLCSLVIKKIISQNVYDTRIDGRKITWFHLKYSKKPELHFKSKRIAIYCLTKKQIDFR